MCKNRTRPVHPGEIVREELLAPLGMSVNALAKALNVPAMTLSASGAASAPTPPCAWHAISVAMRVPG